MRVAVDGYMSSPERGTRGSYEEPYYSQYGTRGNSVAPIIDEELRFVCLLFIEYLLRQLQLAVRLFDIKHLNFMLKSCE